MKDLYYILGAERDCTTAELTSAYRKLAQKLQVPGQEYDYFLDRHFEEITEAYQILTDPARRRKYDANYKKQQQQKFYYFKLRHLNIAVTLALITFTGLFGYYVINSLSKSTTKKVAATQIMAPTLVKHAKKKHKPKRITDLKEKKSPVVLTNKTDSESEKIASNSAPVETPIRAEQPKPISEKPKPAVDKKWLNAEAKSPVVNGDVPPAEEQKPTPPPAPTNNKTAVLVGNVTGLIYLHQTPSYRSAVVASIPNNSRVSVLEKNQSFYKVSYNDQVGYVPKWTVKEQ